MPIVVGFHQGKVTFLTVRPVRWAVLRFVRLAGTLRIHLRGDVFMYHDASTAVLLDLRRRFKAVGDVVHAMIRDWGYFGSVS